MSRYLIYGLIDPRSGELRYVGQTVKSVYTRRAQHLYDGRHGKQNRRSRWLRQLLVAGFKPEVEVLETCATVEALNEAEQFYIAYWRMIGANLTNATDGGDGACGHKVPAGSIRPKLSYEFLGRWAVDRFRTRPAGYMIP